VLLEPGPRDGRSILNSRKEHDVNDQIKPDATPSSQTTRRPWRRLAIASLIGTLAAGLGAGPAHAHGGPGGWGGWHRGFDDADPQAMQRRAEASVRWMLADIDATEAQQKKIAEIMTASMKDLRPLREQARDARRQALEILSKPQIDRGALETLRAQQAQLVDQISRRITQSLADAAEVLTPDQRAKLAERMERRRGHRGRGRG
jgi:Spy/CpxP family protein refolding chaperone